MKAMIATLSLSLLISPTAMAVGTSAGYGMGGQFSRFDPIVAQYNQSGELFRIKGHCQSAGTLFLCDPQCLHRSERHAVVPRRS